MNKTIACFILIILATFIGLSVYKIDNLPNDNSCTDFNYKENGKAYNCQNYTLIEKFRYVWKLY